MKLKFRTKLAYGVGNLGYGTIAQMVSNFIMFFGTSILGLPGTLVGIAIALSVFWDGISDPIIGYFSDRHNSKIFGKRLGFMLIGTLGVAIFNLLLWVIPMEMSVGLKFCWLLVSLLAIETFNTLFATPYVALGIDIAPDYSEQSSVQGFKTTFFILGMVMPSVLMFLFMPGGEGAQGQFNQSAYINIAYFTSALCLIAGAICILGTLKKVQSIYKEEKKKKREKNFFFKIFYLFFTSLKKKNYGSLIIGYSVALISAAFLTSVGMHLFTYSYHFGSTQISILMSILFVSAILSQPFWIYLSNRIDKKPALNISLLIILIGIGLTALTFIFRGLMSQTLLFWLVAPCILFCGFGTGALYSLPISMYADVITMDRLETGENNTAIYSGFMTLAYNIANCLALLVIGVLLDIIKFDPKQPVQALSVQNWLGVIVFLGCAISISLAMLIFSKYKLKRADVLKAKMKEEKRAKNLQDKK